VIPDSWTPNWGRAHGVVIRDTASSTAKRSQSLGQATAFGLEFGDSDAFLREFLDEFYVESNPERRAAMLADEPPMIGEDHADASYAAVAHTWC
jgi:hypothetical protein